MLWLFTSGKRTRVAPGGRTMRADCPECRRERELVEVEVETSAGVWFIDVLSDTERLWRCTGCGENFELRDKPKREQPSPPPKPARDMRAELERERARREAETRRRERKVDDELAALKKKLGK